jgi:cation diffusion facilitator CzcD-associated flavoprotein CzcO
VTFSNDYFPALTQPNAELVTDPIREVTETGIVTADGAHRELDSIVLATGFYNTDPPFAEWVHGRGGVRLADQWGGNPRAYLGIAAHNFPNLFFFINQNTGVAHSSIVFMLECQFRQVMGALRAMDERGAASVEAKAEAVDEYDAEMERLNRGTVWTSGCRSPYIDRSGRNRAVWPTYTWHYWRRTRRFDSERYVLRPPAPRRAPSPLTAEPA